MKKQDLFLIVGSAVALPVAGVIGFGIPAHTVFLTLGKCVLGIVVLILILVFGLREIFKRGGY